MMRWIVTGDDAKVAGRSPAEYAAELAPVLAPYGVEIVLEADQTGTGGLIGGSDQKDRYDIEEAVRRVRSAGGANLAELDDDPAMAPSEKAESGSAG